MNTCYLSDSCPHYGSGDNKPPNHQVRLTVPCVKFLKGCEMDMSVRFFYGETIACNIADVREKKRRLEEGWEVIS